jgi:hypothetical protein
MWQEPRARGALEILDIKPSASLQCYNSPPRDKQQGKIAERLISRMSVPKTCAHCGEEFQGRPNQDYCGAICRNAAAVKRRKGSTADRRNYRKFLKSYCECPRCGPTVEYLEIELDGHHKDGNRKNNTPSNIMTLAAGCHRILEQQNRIRAARGLPPSLEFPTELLAKKRSRKPWEQIPDDENDEEEAEPHLIGELYEPSSRDANRYTIQQERGGRWGRFDK